MRGERRGDGRRERNRTEQERRDEERRDEESRGETREERRVEMEREWERREGETDVRSGIFRSFLTAYPETEARGCHHFDIYRQPTQEAP